MSGGLEIVRIRVGAPVPRGIPNPKTGEVPRWLPIAITVHNPTTDLTFHVIAKLQRLDYDRVSRTLDLLLKEPDEDPDPGLTLHFSLPSFKRVDPGASEVIDVSVPAVINRINAVTREGAQLERLPTEELQQVHCVIAYDVEPFLPEPGATNEAARKQMAQWGKVAEATLAPEMADQAEAS